MNRKDCLYVAARVFGGLAVKVDTETAILPNGQPSRYPKLFLVASTPAGAELVKVRHTGADWGATLTELVKGLEMVGAI